MVLSISRWK